MPDYGLYSESAEGLLMRIKVKGPAWRAVNE